MSCCAAVILLAVMAVGCSEQQLATLPTTPTMNQLAATDPAPSSSRLLRREQWRLHLTIRSVLGATCEAEVIGQTRQVDLGMDFRDNGTVVMYYEFPEWPTGHQAEWKGWTLDHGFEGSGLAYEGLPCSGIPHDRAGAPTTLTGYFSDGGRTFTGVEVRRYMDRPTGEIVYHLEWRATLAVHS